LGTFFLPIFGVMRKILIIGASTLMASAMISACTSDILLFTDDMVTRVDMNYVLPEPSIVYDSGLLEDLANVPASGPSNLLIGHPTKPLPGPVRNKVYFRYMLYV
jgi:hypothetical protein